MAPSQPILKLVGVMLVLSACGTLIGVDDLTFSAGAGGAGGSSASTATSSSTTNTNGSNTVSGATTAGQGGNNQGGANVGGVGQAGNGGAGGVNAGGAGGNSNPINCSLDPACPNPDPFACTCAGCNNDGMCEQSDDCVCPDCAGSMSCDINCADDDSCDPYREGCNCADCVNHPLCEAG